jgi:hypothetical protein
METRHTNVRLSIYGMGDVSTFMIKGDTPLVTRVSLYLHNRRCAIVTRVSFFVVHLPLLT